MQLLQPIEDLIFDSSCTRQDRVARAFAQPELIFLGSDRYALKQYFSSMVVLACREVLESGPDELLSLAGFRDAVEDIEATLLEGSVTSGKIRREGAPRFYDSLLEQWVDGVESAYRSLRTSVHSQAKLLDDGLGDRLVDGFEAMETACSFGGLEKGEFLHAARSNFTELAASTDWKVGFLANLLGSFELRLSGVSPEETLRCLEQAASHMRVGYSELEEWFQWLRYDTLWQLDMHQEAKDALVRWAVGTKRLEWGASIVARAAQHTLTKEQGVQIAERVLCSSPLMWLFMGSHPRAKQFTQLFETVDEKSAVKERMVWTTAVKDKASMLQKIESAGKVLGSSLLLVDPVAEDEPVRLEAAQSGAMAASWHRLKIAAEAAEYKALATAVVEKEIESRTDALRAVGNKMNLAATRYEEALAAARYELDAASLNVRSAFDLVDKEGARAEKGCMIGAAFGCSSFAFYVVLASYLAFKGIYTATWKSPIAIGAIVVSCAPIVVAACIQFACILRRFGINGSCMKAMRLARQRYEKRLESAEESKAAVDTALQDEAAAAARNLEVAHNAMKLLSGKAPKDCAA